MFSDRLKNLRIEKSLSMRRVALDLNMAYTTYVSYEKNEREPNSEALIAIANYFDCSIDFLIGRSSQVKMATLDNQNISLLLSSHEKNVITAYRDKPDMQPAVDRLLGVDDEEYIPVAVAARSEDNTPAGIKYISKKKLEEIRNAPSVEGEVDL